MLLSEKPLLVGTAESIARMCQGIRVEYTDSLMKAYGVPNRIDTILAKVDGIVMRNTATKAEMNEIEKELIALLGEASLFGDEIPGIKKVRQNTRAHIKILRDWIY